MARRVGDDDDRSPVRAIAERRQHVEGFTPEDSFGPDDLLARLAGLRLADRWGGWHRQPYTGEDLHVSVSTRAGTGR